MEIQVQMEKNLYFGHIGFFTHVSHSVNRTFLTNVQSVQSMALIELIA